MKDDSVCRICRKYPSRSSSPSPLLCHIHLISVVHAHNPANTFPSATCTCRIATRVGADPRSRLTSQSTPHRCMCHCLHRLPHQLFGWLNRPLSFGVRCSQQHVVWPFAFSIRYSHCESYRKMPAQVISVQCLSSPTLL